MNIVILGAGTVGTSVARLLCERQHNVYVVDVSGSHLQALEEKLDLHTILGSASDAVTLFQAGAPGADLCLALTNRDEMNLVGASIAKAMGCKKTVARLVNPAFMDNSTFDYQHHFKIDLMLSLEHLTALELAKSIRTTGLFAVENFARGGIEAQEYTVVKSSKVLGIPLRELTIPSGVKIGLLSKETGSRIPGGNDIIEMGDHVTLIGDRRELDKVRSLFQYKPPARQRVVIAGGGEIGFQFARSLDSNLFSVTMLESDAERCQVIARKLPEVMVYNIDATSRTELEEARVGGADVFLSATGHDADNIVSALEAKELGAQHIMSVVRRSDYASVLSKLGIHKIVSPREAMENLVTGYVDEGPIIRRAHIGNGDAQIWEVEIREGSGISDTPLKSLQLPNCLIAAIMRDDYVIVPGADDVLNPGETAVIIVQQESIPETIDLLQSAS